MVTLYYSPGACSQAPHILMHELGIEHDARRVHLKSKTLEDGSDYLRINPKGAVPALELENGEVLTENAVILQYLGDRSGSSDLFPPLGDFRRYRVLEWLNYVATELHKGFAPLWNPAAANEWKQATRDQLAKKFDYVERQLGDRPFLTGNNFTIADAYLFVMLGWTAMNDIDLGRWPGLTAFYQRAAERPSVRQVLEFEGLVETETAS